MPARFLRRLLAALAVVPLLALWPAAPRPRTAARWCWTWPATARPA
ncbi:hypothetical protein ACFQ1L_39625 [Phytohabitans flavus]